MAIVKHIYCLLGSLGSWHKCFSPNPNLISRVSAMSGVVTSNTHSLSLPTPLLFHPLLHLMISNLSHFHRFFARFLLIYLWKLNVWTLSCFQQLKSHLLEISDSLFQLNLSLHSVLSQQPPPPSLESGAAEAALRSAYSRWQATHHNLTRAEARHHKDQVRIILLMINAS